MDKEIHVFLRHRKVPVVNFFAVGAESGLDDGLDKPAPSCLREVR